MENIKGIGTSILYGSVNPSFFNNKRILQLTSTQREMVLYSMLSLEYCGSKRTGIYNLSTAEFPRSLPMEEIQDQLGRTDAEISLKLRNVVGLVTPDEKEHYRGNLNKYFSDIIEYDPYNDMVFAKLAFAYSGVNYLTTSAAIIEGIATEFKHTKRSVPERWWGEFMGINSRRIHEAWQDVNTPRTRIVKNEETKQEYVEEYVHKNLPSLKKTFDHLFELEKQYSPSAKKITPEKKKLMKDFLEDKNISSQPDFFKTS